MKMNVCVITNFILFILLVSNSLLNGNNQDLGLTNKRDLNIILSRIHLIEGNDDTKTSFNDKDQQQKEYDDGINTLPRYRSLSKNIINSRMG